MAFKTLKNLITKVTHPNRRDFIDMGLGIEARAKRCYKYWKPHLELTKAFQRRSIEGLSKGGKIAVLGAGSLLDVDIGELQKHFSIIELFDANPLAKSHWKRLATSHSSGQIRANIVDLGNSIDSWTERLTRFLAQKTLPDQNKLSDFIDSLEVGPTAKLPEKLDVVFSINLLSQIPIYWRDRVHQLIYRKLGIDTDKFGLYSSNLQKALEKSMANLQLHHLMSLSLSTAKLIVLISDVEFLYYEKNRSEWQKENAIYFSEALEINGYLESLRDTWLWHIIPQGLEEQDYGSYHKILALAYNRTLG